MYKNLLGCPMTIRKTHLKQLASFRLLTIRMMIMLFIAVVALQSTGQELDNQWPALEGDGTLRRLRVPILMYHYVSPLPPDADAVRIGLTLDPNTFRQHI